MTLWQLVNSPITPAIVLAVAPFLIGRFNIKPFFDQQKAQRLQKFYYDETLLGVLNNFDDAMEIARKNRNRFVSAIDVFQVYFESGNANEFINEILKSIEHFLPYSGFRMKVFMEIFPNGYDVYQWARRTPRGFALFNNLITERLKEAHFLIKDFETKQQHNDNEDAIRNTLSKYANEINLFYYLLQKNEVLFFLFRRIVDQFNTFEFRSREEILNATKIDPELKKLNHLFSECYQKLFGYYELEPKKVYCTYATIPTGERYKIVFFEDGTKSVRAEKINSLSDEQFFILVDETYMVDAIIDETDIPLAQKLYEMVNSYVLGEEYYKMLPIREKLF